MRTSMFKPEIKAEGKTSVKSIEEKIQRGDNIIEGVEERKPDIKEVVKSETEENILEEEKSSDLSDAINSDIEKGEPVEEPKMHKMTGGRIVGMVIVGMLSSALIGLVVCGLYYNYIRYPAQMKEDYASSGLCGIETWVKAINTLDNDTIKSITGEDSYLAKEIEYANGVDYKIDFIKKMLGTVSYVEGEVEAKNVYGNPLLDKNDEVIYKKSLVNGEGEEVTFSYIDYSKIKLDQSKIKEIMSEVGLNVGDVDYSNKLIEVFCKYMVALEDDEIPLVSKQAVPNMKFSKGKYSMLPDEDIMLDRLLFSSEDFFKLLNDFSMLASGGVDINPEWEEWDALSDEEKAETREPDKVFTLLQPTQEWTEWHDMEAEEKEGLEEPTKYDSKKFIRMDWCGAYYLSNEYAYIDDNGNEVKKPISAEVGDGTLENPAGMNTDIITYVLQTAEDGSKVAKPIRIRLIDYKVSQDAIDYFESKDERNRGYDIKSEVQYACYTFEVTNLSEEPLTINDNSSLADDLANLSPRTGIIYGMQDSVTLNPDETGIIESWGSSTELNTKYLIWGSDFKRQEPVVWFRVLAGNIDDPSEDKGVTLNKTRFEDEEEEDESIYDTESTELE